ncbi:hypothetical protein KHA80_13015 [Anaerobacillus sp. HL2]|nr:hypothetical protein KHA80_13015 [Anaerobacillus sp. HL2]
MIQRFEYYIRSSMEIGKAIFIRYGRIDIGSPKGVIRATKLMFFQKNKRNCIRNG